MKQQHFTTLCDETHSLITSFLNQVALLEPEINASTSALVEERVSASEFVLRLRLDFQPLFINDIGVDELWDEIRGKGIIQEMVTMTTLRLLTHVDLKFHHSVAADLGAACSELVLQQGALDADFHERMIDPQELTTLIEANPWFATVLLITMGRKEYVKPDFLGLG